MQASLKINGEQHAHRYTPIKLETLSVFGSGRPGWGVKFQSCASRTLISDNVRWFEQSAQQRDDFIAAVLAGKATA